MSTLIVTRGLPASGKTTWARQWIDADPARRARVNRDDLRQSLYAAPMLTWELENHITTVQRAAVLALLSAGVDVVVDDMHLRPKYVREWQRFAAAHGHEIQVNEFYVTVDDAIARDAARDRTVGEGVIRRLAGKYLRPSETAGLCGYQMLPLLETPADDTTPAVYEPKPGATRAVIVDIDGTLALHGDRDPYDLSRCGDDTPNWPVIEAVQAAKRDDLQVIYCSGREDVARATTAQWIADHVEVPGLLLMRSAGDRRRDSIVKRELFDQHIRNEYDVRYVLDDRQQVVDMWRSLGLTVFQVARGDF